MARELSDWVESYMHFTRHDEAADIFHRWTAITVLSAAINRNCWMSRAYYKCFPNLYTLFVGPSGVGKSSSSGIGVSLMSETSVCQNIYKDAVTPPAILTFMSQPEKRVQYEYSGKLLEKTPIFIYASELGNLLSQRGSIKELTLLLTELFNKQGDHEDTTISRGVIKIVKPIVTFLGGCPPKFIEEELPTSTLRSGFMGRMLTIRADSKRFHNPEPRLSIEDLELKEKLKRDLEKIASLYGEVIFDNEAYEFWLKWYTDQPLDLSHLDADVEGFSSRKAQFVQRVAMLLTISKGDRLEIDKETLIRAITLVGECEKSSASLAIQDKVSQLSEYVSSTILRYCIRTGNKGITKTELMRLVSRRINARLLHEILEQLILEGRVHVHGASILLKEGGDIARAFSKKGKKVKDAAKRLKGKTLGTVTEGEEDVDS